jgi:hypothetical protein
MALACEVVTIRNNEMMDSSIFGNFHDVFSLHTSDIFRHQDTENPQSPSTADQAFRLTTVHYTYSRCSLRTAILTPGRVVSTSVVSQSPGSTVEISLDHTSYPASGILVPANPYLQEKKRCLPSEYG